VWIE
jgi:hypothetical protein